MSKAPPLFFPQERTRRGGSRATRGKRSLVRKSLAVFRPPKLKFLYEECFFSYVQAILLE
nr:hypothetical protein [[Bacillus] enclensis]